MSAKRHHTQQVVQSPKNVLQEYCQLYRLPLPRYLTKQVSGPGFRSVCVVFVRPELWETLQCGEETAISILGEFCTKKKCAEISAAEKMLRELAHAEESVSREPCSVERIDLAGGSFYADMYDDDDEDAVPKTFFLWDVENYKIRFDLREFEPCVLFAVDSDGSHNSSSIQTVAGLLSHPESRVIQITSPTRLQHGADVAIIWVIARSCECAYLGSTNCVILSRDKLFCTVKDVCDSWRHGFKSVTLMST